MSSVPSLSSTFSSVTSILRHCKISGHLNQVHAAIIRRGLEQDYFIITQFINICNSSSNISYAINVFNTLLNPDICLWNCLLRGHCNRSSSTETILILYRMILSGTVPDKYTFPSLIKACSRDNAIIKGKLVHGLCLKYGLDDDLYVRTSLIDFYVKCQEFKAARQLFDVMPEKNDVSWTALIAGFANAGDLKEARKLLDEMPHKNVASWNSIIGAYMKCGDLDNARGSFDQMPERNMTTYTVMIDGFSKAGDMTSAKNFFNQSPSLDLFTWSAMISGYAQNSQPDEALGIFSDMISKGIEPDEFIMVSIMSACSQIGNPVLAKWVDSYVHGGWIDVRRTHVVAALIDLNAKSGNLERATELFENMDKKDLVSYCSMMKGLTLHGRFCEVISLFERMINEGIKPDNVAFTIILTACSNGRLVKGGLYYFDMVRNYSITPSPDHYACMVDLLGRSGQLEMAYDLIKSTPFEPHAGAWGALLGACELHANMELAEIIARRIFDLEPDNASSYVLLSNIYAAAEKWSGVTSLRKEMKLRGIKKIPGFSRCL